MKYLLTIITLMAMSPLVWADVEYGTFYEKECSLDRCTIIEYTAPTYYETSRGWELIDNTIGVTGCRAGFGSCMTQSYYQLNMRNTLNNTDAFVMTFGDDEIHFRPSSLSFQNRNTHFLIGNVLNIGGTRTANSIRFNNSFIAGTDLQYISQPTYLKSNLIIRSNTTLPATLLTGEINLSLITDIRVSEGMTIQHDRGNIDFVNRSGSVVFYIPQPFATDARGASVKFNHTITRINDYYSYTLDVPYQWMRNSNRTYPVTIDPTVILNESDILFDGYIHRGIPDTGECELEGQRDGTGTTMLVSFLDGDVCDDYERSVIYFGNTGIPSNAVINNVNLSLYFAQLTDSGETGYFIKNMTANSTTYPDTVAGNIDFWVDAGDGLQYRKEDVLVTGYHSFNLSAESHADIEYKLQNSIDWFGVGIHLDELVSYSLRPTQITTSEGAASQRPRLQIDYRIPLEYNITLNEPAHGTVFENNTHIYLNWTAYSDLGNLTVKIYGSNTSSFMDNGHLLYMSFDIENVTTTTYNWTVPPWNVDADTMILYHFDNLTEYQEDTSKITNFAQPVYNGSVSGNPNYNYSNDIFAANTYFNSDGSNYLTIDNCAFNCFSMTERTYMAWVRVTDLGLSGPLFGSYDSDALRGFSVEQNTTSLIIKADGEQFEASSFFQSTSQWEHIAVTTTSSGDLIVYKNGLEFLVAGMNSITDPSLDFFIAHVNLLQDIVHTDFYIDEFIIVNRTMTATEIYNATHLSDGLWYWQGDAIVNRTEHDLSEQRMFNISFVNTAIDSVIVDEAYQAEMLLVDTPGTLGSSPSATIQQQGFLRKLLTQLWGFMQRWTT